jgi:hypothetical protein
MKTKTVLCFAVLAFCGSALAAAPVQNVSHHKHPNIAAAQRLATQAYEKIVAAQRANEFDLGGHAQHAKDLLDEVNRELKAAAETSNAEHH